jgi:hypothetical protein
MHRCSMFPTNRPGDNECNLLGKQEALLLQGKLKRYNHYGSSRSYHPCLALYNAGSASLQRVLSLSLPETDSSRQCAGRSGKDLFP